MRRFAALGWSLALILCFGLWPQSAANQGLAPAQRAAQLRQLRDTLAASDSLRDADTLIILGERAVAEAARQLVGLEVKLTGGALLHLTSVAVELKPAAALVQLGVQVSPSANSSAALNLRLSGHLGSGEADGARLRLPFQLTEVALESGEPQSPWLRGLFSDWLSPDRLNALLPPFDIPLELSQVIEIPGGRFEVEGWLPMEVTSQAYQARADFSLAALLMLDRRMVIALRLAEAATREDAGTLSGRRNEGRPQMTAASESEVAALESEIARLSQGLASEADLRLRLRRRVLNSLLAQVAAARETDLALRLKPARLRAEEVDGWIRVLNHTDIEGGDGRVDLRRLSVERIEGGKLEVRLDARGELEARLRGREYGIPYRLSPRGAFAVKNEVVPLEVVEEGERLRLRALPGSLLPVEVRLGLDLAGQELGFSRTITVPADRWLKPLALPTPLRREWQRPRQIAVSSGSGMQVISSEAGHYTLSKLRVKAGDDAIEITSDLAISSR
jgi:hypothetical protein